MFCLECNTDISHKRKGAKFCGVACSNTYKGRQVAEKNKGSRITCSICNTPKPPNQFSYSVRGDVTSGKKDYCKRCGANEAERKRRERTWKDDAIKVMLMNSRQRAKRDGLEHTLTREDIVIPDRCPVLSIELKRQGRKKWVSTPSIDRIDNNKGYIPGNIVVVSIRANVLKRDATTEELRMIADFYERLQ
jgi:hypothetical protein